MQVTQARKQLSSLYSRLSRGGIEVIERNRERDVVAVNASEYQQLLEDSARFHVEIQFGQGSVAVWMRDLPVHAEGVTLEEALDALAAALVDYASAWNRYLGQFPNHAAYRSLVRRVELAGTKEAVRRLVEADAAREQESYESAESAPAPA